MLEKARGGGQTLVEWARETLLGELEDDTAKDGACRRCGEKCDYCDAGDDKAMRRVEPVRVAGRRTGTPKRVAEPAASPEGAVDGVVHEYVEQVAVQQVRGTKTCVHGVAKGWRCWQCGGPAIIE
jgi:hypothetical protein